MKISMILVEPETPQNVGAVARALKNMGLSDLRLVNPCDYLSDKAKALAHGSEEFLEKAQVYPSLKEALHSCDFVMGTTAKQRALNKQYLEASTLPSFLEEKEGAFENIALVFGRESAGLTNDEIDLCHLVTGITMNQDYPAINLAQAVMIYAYELTKAKRVLRIKEQKRFEISGQEVPPEQLPQMFQNLEKKVQDILLDLNLTPEDRSWNKLMGRLPYLNVPDMALLHFLTQKYKLKKTLKE